MTDLTPIDLDRCKICGGNMFVLNAGEVVPGVEPNMCVLERDGAWAFCAGMRKGWTRLTYEHAVSKPKP